MDQRPVKRIEQREAYTSMVLAITEYGLGKLGKAGYNIFFRYSNAEFKVFRSRGLGSGKANEVDVANSLLSDIKLSKSSTNTQHDD